MTPRVSICVPNLNTRPFLAERFETISEQSFQDWEVLVYDGYSTDGAWEFISGLAAGDRRMRAWQGPREGTPGSWSPCVREARGEYVYIATSDDTMARDCLEKLVGVLEAHPECDVAHCPLRAIDEHGRTVHEAQEWWSHDSSFAVSSGALLHRLHVRLAPFDGLLHLLGESVYTSITQLLIRRSLFDRVGLFESTWGSVGDFNWGMRAGLVANTVHVPDTWAGWRLHACQATAGIRFGSVEHALRIDAMIEHAIASTEGSLAPPVRERLRSQWSPRARELRTFWREVAGRHHYAAGRRWAFLVRRLLTGSAPAREYVTSRVIGRPSPDWVRRCLREAGCGNSLVTAADIVYSTPTSDLTQTSVNLETTYEKKC